MKTLKTIFVLGLSILAVETVAQATQQAPVPAPANPSADGPIVPPCNSISGQTGGNAGQGTTVEKKDETHSGDAGK